MCVVLVRSRAGWDGGEAVQCTARSTSSLLGLTSSSWTSLLPPPAKSCALHRAIHSLLCIKQPPTRIPTNPCTTSPHSLHASQVRTSEAASERAVLARLHLVDLAGSERTKKTGASGTTLREAQFINRSLSFLEQAVGALVRREAHVPFRQSRLTSVLRDALGGNCKVRLCACLCALFCVFLCVFSQVFLCAFGLWFCAPAAGSVCGFLWRGLLAMAWSVSCSIDLGWLCCPSLISAPHN